MRITLTKPKRSIIAAPKGHRDAKIKYIRPVAMDMSEMVQPSSFVIGKISICGTLPTADENTVAKNAIVSATQP